MYKAKFAWKQNTKFPIYKRVIDDYLKKANISASADGTSVPGGGELVGVSVYLPILEDFSYEIKSSFQGYAEAMGSVSSIAGSILGFFEKLNTLSAIGGQASSSQEFMKFQVWKETEPFRMAFKFVLETKTDPFIDVYAPAMALSSMSILSPVTEDSGGIAFYTPGVNAGGLKALSRDKNVEPTESSSGSTSTGSTTSAAKPNATPKEVLTAWSKNSKLLDSFSIVASRINGDGGNGLDSPKPNTVFTGNESDEIALLVINDAFIESCKPTWSKDRTASGIPVRCELEVTVQSIFSANDAMFGWLKKNSGRGLLDVAGDAAATVATNVFR